MLTATTETEPAEQAVRLGAFGFVRKPFDFREIGALVEAALMGAEE